jgi:hypothetical protein
MTVAGVNFGNAAAAESWASITERSCTVVARNPSREPHLTDTGGTVILRACRR